MLAESERSEPAPAVVAGSAARLRADGRLLTKVGRLPVVVFWHEGSAYAVEDRCPHMGFPLHRGTVEAGLVTCHWHHARFDLRSGCTLDLWADDARAFDVDIVGDDVLVAPRPDGDEIGRLHQRLRDGLEEGLTLVVAKAVLGLLDHGVGPGPIVRTGVRFGATYRGPGWGAGLTVLVAMANVLDRLDEEDRAAALVHALAFVSRDTRGHAPRFEMGPLHTDEVERERLADWYRRFIDTRSTDAAERVLVTALASPVALDDVERMMLAAVTDHVFVDGGHTLDFTNKAFEAVDLLGEDVAPLVLPTLVDQTAHAGRSEEGGAWRHPHDLAALVDRAAARLPGALAAGAERADGTFDDVSGLASELLVDDPQAVADAVLSAIESGASPEQLGRALAYAAALRITRFHTQNDFGDWDSVHHAFTAANALHHSLERAPSPELLRGVIHGALRVYLDRFLNVPAARLPTAVEGDLADLARCWEVQGEVDRAGEIAYGYLAGGGTREALVAALGHALLGEDVEFHWFQVYEAAVRQAFAWPEGSEESALVLAGLARFVAAHTPTRRELPRVVEIANRLRRGENLFEDAAAREGEPEGTADR
jgi:nitrite reductase/ring-hydroxylating ferredoxin subunit